VTFLTTNFASCSSEYGENALAIASVFLDDIDRRTYDVLGDRISRNFRIE